MSCCIDKNIHYCIDSEFESVYNINVKFNFNFNVIYYSYVTCVARFPIGIFCDVDYSMYVEVRNCELD